MLSFSLLPLGVLLAISVINRSHLGMLWVGFYFTSGVVLFLLPWMIEIERSLAIAFQAILAVALLLHVKIKTL